MDSFAEVIGHLLITHARVRALDRGALSDKRKAQRAVQMRALRKNADKLVTQTFADLAEQARDHAVALEAASKRLAQDLKAQKTAVQVLDTVGSALTVITRLISLLA
jgi:hypothetical protein